MTLTNKQQIEILEKALEHININDPFMCCAIQEIYYGITGRIIPFNNICEIIPIFNFDHFKEFVKYRFVKTYNCIRWCNSSNIKIRKKFLKHCIKHLKKEINNS